MNYQNIEQLEKELLLTTLEKRWGYNFKKYDSSTINRRIKELKFKLNLEHVSELIPPLLHDKSRSTLLRVINCLTVGVTEFFRDPDCFKELQKKVISYLKTYHFIKIWHCGCSTGEEVYSMAIMLHEANLLDKCQIYATDIDEIALGAAKRGVYAEEKIIQAEVAYHKAGGRRDFKEYFSILDQKAIVNYDFRRKITFSNHDLVNDESFGEMNLIFIRNVLIYFNKDTKLAILQLIDESLIDNGFICMGKNEVLKFSELENRYKNLTRGYNLLQKRKSK